MKKGDKEMGIWGLIVISAFLSGYMEFVGVKGDTSAMLEKQDKTIEILEDVREDTGEITNALIVPVPFSFISGYCNMKISST